MKSSSYLGYILCVAFIQSLCSCNFAIFSPNYRKEWQRAKYQDCQDNGIDNLLNTRGYFASPHQEYYPGMVHFFYKDGTCATTYFKSPEMLMASDIDVNPELFGYVWSDGDWGWNAPYTIVGDTIIVDEYILYLNSWNLKQKTIKIIDRNTIVLASETWYAKDTTAIHPNTFNDTLYFVPTKSIPAPNIGIKKKKFAWRTEAEYKKFKKELNENKHSSKHSQRGKK